jgi:cation diffusion facilitator CzcD-associated flavoprotein CzcO
VAYADEGLPVSLDTFVDYGRWFQRRLVPHLESDTAVCVTPASHGFRVHLDSGEVVRAEHLVVAVGAKSFAYTPEPLESLPSELCTHASAYGDLSKLSDSDVLVVGAGQSALESAALLDEAGARVRVLVRAPAVKWTPAPTPHRSLARSVRRPRSGLGSGWRTMFYANAPRAFRHLPEAQRLNAVRTALGPAGAWWLRSRLSDDVQVMVSHEVIDARRDGDKVRLQVANQLGSDELTADHVLAATGYRVRPSALSWLDPQMSRSLRRTGDYPLLSPHFESSVPGLYFVGLAAAGTFGPALRFVWGTRHVGPALSSRLAEIHHQPRSRHSVR